MSAQGIIKRYTLLIEKIDSGRFPSKKELIAYLDSKGFKISDRTFQRTLEQFREEFGLDINYNNQTNGYYINHETSINVNSFYKFLEIAGTAELLSESLKDSKESLKYVNLEAPNNLKGIEYLRDLLLAVREHRIIEFEYQRFQVENISHNTIEPYLLKEYQNRWYIFGRIYKTDKFRTYGIDRLKKLKLTDKTFIYDNSKSKSYYFDYVIGLNYSNETPENVILSYIPEQADYIKTLPLHNSQEVLIDNDEELRIQLEVIPNFELEQKILLQGERVKVLEPKWLADKIKGRLEEAVKNYK